MSVARLDLNKCVGCGNCVKICPMDVFYFDNNENKSVLAYPEQCQSCAQCYLHCIGNSLTMSCIQSNYSIGAGRGLRTFTNVMPAAEEGQGGGWGGGDGAAKEGGEGGGEH